MGKKSFKERIDQNINWLTSDKEKKANEIKDGVTPLINMLDSKSFKEHQDELLQYMKCLEDFDKELFKKFDDRYDEIAKFEKETPETKKEKVATSNTSPSKNNQNIKSVNQQQKKPTVVKNHSNDLNKLEQNMNNSFQQLSDQVQAVGNTSTLKKELDNLQADLSFKIKKQFEDRKDIYEELETLPVTLKGLSTKIDSIQIPSTSSMNTNLEIPKDEQAVVELTKFMKDGLDQFENIARYYIKKQLEFDKVDEVSQSNQDALAKAEETSLKAGKRSEKIRLATEIFNKFPEKFNDIKSVFEDILIEEYELGQVIDITQANRQEYEIKISGIKAESKITIESSAILIGGEIVKKATIKESN